MNHLLAELKAFFVNLFSDVEHALSPGIQFIAQNGGKYALDLATHVLQQFEANASWSSIVASFVEEAAKDGITLAEGAASAVLNAAKLNLLAAGSGTVDAGLSGVEGPDPVAAPSLAEAQTTSAAAADTPVITNPDHPDFGK